MTIALAKYLKDFSEPQPVIPDFPSDFDDAAFDDGAAFTAPEPVDIEATQRESYAQGHEAATLELGEQHRAQLEELHAAYRDEIDALRHQHEAEISGRIAEKIGEIAWAVARRVSEQTAEVLAPVMTEMLAVQAVEHMAELLHKAILDGTVGTIVVKGPESLYALLKEKMGEDAMNLRHVDEADLDLSVELNGTVLVTRLSAWTASLKKVLE